MNNGWHKYPDEKPDVKKDTLIIVHLTGDYTFNNNGVNVLTWFVNWDKFSTEHLIDAWMYLPEPPVKDDRQ